MKASYKIYLIIIILSASCKESRLKNNYLEYKSESINKLNDSSMIINQDFKSYETYTNKVLSKEELNFILDLELQELYENMEGGIGYSKEAIVHQDTIIKRRYCATSDIDGPDVQKIINLPSDNKRMFFSRAFTLTHRIPINFILVQEQNGVSLSSKNELLKQLEILNSEFNYLNIEFYLNSFKDVFEPDWYDADPRDSLHIEMAEKHAINSNREINIFVGNYSNILGLAVFPWDKKRHQTNQDHIWLNYVTFSDRNTYYLGKTIIHEMGHYFGLFHTFHMAQNDENKPFLYCNNKDYNGCSPTTDNVFRGDRIDDTPPQKICHEYGCGTCGNNGEGRGCESCSNSKTCDTCPNDNEVDPVKNFMGYNPDSCMNHFTEGQYFELEKWFFAKRRYLSDSFNPS